MTQNSKNAFKKVKVCIEGMKRKPCFRNKICLDFITIYFFLTSQMCPEAFIIQDLRTCLFHNTCPAMRYQFLIHNLSLLILKEGEEQGSKSPFSLLSKPISPSSLSVYLTFSPSSLFCSSPLLKEKGCSLIFYFQKKKLKKRHGRNVSQDFLFSFLFILNNYWK